MQEIYEALFHASPLGMIVFDRAGTILAVNDRQVSNSGVAREMLVGRKVGEVYAGVIERYGLAQHLRELLEDGRPFRTQIERYEPQFLEKVLRFALWGFPLADGERFCVLTEGIDLERVRGSPEIVGASRRMTPVFRFIEQAARVNTPVLLYGESGTGKELVAHAIHARSDRARGPFLALNCAALPGTLLEATLFGSEKGAYTGADRRTKGFFEAAEGGVLFLDEIGESSLEFQAKLLRVLQDGMVTRVGGTEPIRTDVRVMCATNRDLEAEVAAGRFRLDLLYRIDVLQLRLPALRDRPEDIPLLAQHFLRELDEKHHLGRKHLAPAALEAFLGYRWPGNVRELANVLESAYVTSAEQVIGLDHLPNRIRDGAAMHAPGQYVPQSYRDALKRFRREYYRQLMSATNGDVRRAARIAGVNASTLYRLAPPKRRTTSA